MVDSADSDGAIPLRERRTFADEWAQYERDVLPAGVGEVQRRETKVAFHAGAFVLFTLFTGGLDSGRDATALDIAYAEGLRRELIVVLEQEVK